jgi:NADH-quinone oxidoreductase subunit F
VTRILLRDIDIPDIAKLDVYVANGGYEGLKKALNMDPEDVIERVRASGLRGRGGAGFPAGVKWNFIPKDREAYPVRYVVVNADESEPGTFKDRQLLENNPHQVLEGALIAAYAIHADAIYIYCRGEFWDLTQVLDDTIEIARRGGFVGENILGSGWNCEIYTHLGAGAYICGEETALLESLEGKRGQPRLRPPFPALEGLYAKPTVVNNVETLANVPYILDQGVDAYRQFGTERSSGPKIFSLSGHVNKPGNYELPLGTTFRELIYEHGGGMRGDKVVKGILPAGASAPIMPGTDAVLDTPMTYEDLQQHGSSLGSASIIVLDEDTDMVWAARKMVRFFEHESCGQCTPCREGNYWLKQIYERIYTGQGAPEDVEVADQVAAQMEGKCLCALGEFALNPVRATIKHFPDDYKAYVEKKQAPARKQPTPAS